MASQPKKTRPVTKATEQPGLALSAQSSAPADLSTTADGHLTRPDQAAYNEEQNVLRSKIDAVNTQLVGTIMLECSQRFLCLPNGPLCRMLLRRK